MSEPSTERKERASWAIRMVFSCVLAHFSGCADTLQPQSHTPANFGQDAYVRSTAMGCIGQSMESTDRGGKALLTLLPKPKWKDSVPLDIALVEKASRRVIDVPGEAGGAVIVETPDVDMKDRKGTALFSFGIGDAQLGSGKAHTLSVWLLANNFAVVNYLPNYDKEHPIFTGPYLQGKPGREAEEIKVAANKIKETTKKAPFGYCESAGCAVLFLAVQRGAPFLSILAQSPLTQIEEGIKFLDSRLPLTVGRAARNLFLEIGKRLSGFNTATSLGALLDLWNGKEWRSVAKQLDVELQSLLASPPTSRVVVVVDHTDKIVDSKVGRRLSAVNSSEQLKIIEADVCHAAALASADTTFLKFVLEKAQWEPRNP